MEKGKWNWPLVLVVWGVYLVFFIIYLFYSRTPACFTGSRTEGVVIDIYDHVVRAGKAYAKRSSPVVSYYVDSVEYRFYIISLLHAYQLKAHAFWQKLHEYQLAPLFMATSFNFAAPFSNSPIIAMNRKLL